MAETQNPTAAGLVIGNEILSGRTQDCNLNTLARKLGAVGIRLAEARIVADIEAEIIDAVNALRARYTYVFTTGGIGPTHDDITAASIGKAFNLPVEEDASARARIEKYYAGGNLNEARLRMAQMPRGARLIDNPISAAPGFCVENVYVLAGVPSIMQAMLDGVVAGLQHGPQIYTISVSGYVAESVIAKELSDVAQRYPALDVGSYPWVRANRFGTALVVRGIDNTAVKAAADEIAAFVAKHDPAPEIAVNPSAA